MAEQATGDRAFQALQAEVNDWVTELFQGYDPVRVRDRKVIRDGVHGFQRLLPHEVALVDTPVVQRLRFIHQTALAYLVYPTMNHTRFDHSLGMAHVAEKMIQALQVKHRAAITEREVQMVRLAALLHDTGHTVFSHLGEGVLETRFGTRFNDIKRASVGGQERFFEEANSGEILSYLIATCSSMKQFFQEQFSLYGNAGCCLKVEDVDVIAGLIVGRVEPEQRYLADIINGPVDADKLDYIRRDCYFSGIRAEIDVPRIIFGLDWMEQPGRPKHLATDAGVIPQLEQILLAKLMLYTSIYHHHKVRSLECTVNAIFSALAEGTPQQSVMAFGSVADFLRLNEFQFLAWGLEEPLISDQVKRLLNRTLPKRALVINPHTVEGSSRDRLTGIRSALPDERSLTEARAAIFQAIPSQYQTELRDLWLDMPRPPDTDEEAQLCYVRFGDGFRTLADTLPTNDWVETYEAHKLNYFVFYDQGEDQRRAAAESAANYLRNQHDITVTEFARSFAHL